ncbi:MAG: HAD hydrolase-like protein [Lachnospiraceae bacterium]|nr:HAD hydrolase-like protein [Lachnospiraceae bacterium]
MKVADKAVAEESLNRYWTPMDFKKVRMTAEKSAYLKCAEPTLDDIYQNISNLCGDLDRIKDIEIETECENVYVNEEVLELIKMAESKGIKLVLTSDMYLNKNQICKVLISAGVPIDIFDEIFVSCEYGISKSNGDLYNVILEKLNVKADEILHLGDNYNSDYVSARKKDIIGWYYDVKTYVNSSLIMDEIAMTDKFPELHSFRKMVAASVDEVDQDKSRWINMGIHLAPFFTFGIEWVLDTLENEKINCLFPLMREGELYYSMLKQAMVYRKNSLQMGLFYSSRNAMFLNKFNKHDVPFDEEGLNRIYETCAKEEVTIYGLFQLLQIESIYPQELYNEKNVLLSKADLNQKEKIYKYLTDKEVIAVIREKTRVHTNNTRLYLRKMGVLDKKIATLDFGYKATTQTIIEEMLGYDTSNIHLLLLKSEGAVDNIQKGVNIRGYVATAELENTPYSKGCQCGILEVLQMIGTGCTVGYDNNGEPILINVVGIENEQFDKIKWLHQGILLFQRKALPIIHSCKSFRSLKDRGTDLYKLLCRTIIYPTKEEADMLSSLYHEDTFGNMLITKIMSYEESEYESETEIVSARYDGRYRTWIPGMLVQRNPLYYAERKVVIEGKYDDLVLLERVKKAYVNGEKEVVIAGSGEAGEKVYAYCLLVGIKVTGFTDGNKNLHGKIKYGCMITGIDMVNDKTPIIVASIKYYKQIIEEIKQNLGTEAKYY